MALTIAEQLMYSSMQIEMLDNDEKVIGAASGFIFCFCHNGEAKSALQVLVTNRHVLAKCPKIRLFFTKRAESGNPIHGEQISVITVTSNAVFHPNDAIDLAVLPLYSVFEAIQQIGEKAFYYFLNPSFIPNTDTWNKMNAVEDLLMVGYPMGVRDQINNLPVFRRGITATHPKYDFQGQPHFLMDMSCFRGSSGSPVYRYHEGALHNYEENTVSFGTRCELIGIQYQSTTYSEVGELVPIETEVKQVPSTTVFINLGYALKSTLLLDFEPIIKKILDQ